MAVSGGSTVGSGTSVKITSWIGERRFAPLNSRVAHNISRNRETVLQSTRNGCACLGIRRRALRDGANNGYLCTAD